MLWQPDMARVGRYIWTPQEGMLCGWLKSASLTSTLAPSPGTAVYGYPHCPHSDLLHPSLSVRQELSSSPQPGPIHGHFSALFSCQPYPVALLAYPLSGSATGLLVPHPSRALWDAPGSQHHNTYTFIFNANTFSSSCSVSSIFPAVQERAVNPLLHPRTLFSWQSLWPSLVM